MLDTTRSESFNPVDYYRLLYSDYQKHLSGKDIQAINALHMRGIDAFVEKGLPGRRWEDWKYTPMTPFKEQPFIPAASCCYSRSVTDLLSGAISGQADMWHIALVNGRWAVPHWAAPAIPAGASVTSITRALSEPGPAADLLGTAADIADMPFAALNTAFFNDGVVLHVEAGVTLPQTITIMHLTTMDDVPVLTSPRVLIIAEQDASVQVAEIYAGPDNAGYATAAVTEIFAGPNARVDHTVIQREGNKATFVSHVQGVQQADSRLTSRHFSFGAAIARSDINTRFRGTGGEAVLDGLYIADGDRHVDIHSRIDHLQPHCVSNEYYKGILKDKAHGVFNGKLVVHRDAQKTDSRQTNRNLLLDGDARVDTKPQLEIWADDVRCTHGATVGRLDEASLFYLQSRGIDRRSAELALTRGFATEIVQRVPDDLLRTHIDELVTRALTQG